MFKASGKAKIIAFPAEVLSDRFVYVYASSGFSSAQDFKIGLLPAMLWHAPGILTSPVFDFDEDCSRLEFL